MSSTIRQLRRVWRDEAARWLVSPRDVDLLLCDALDRPLSWLLAHDDERAGPRELSRFTETMNRRLTGEPLQYIRRRCEFYGRELAVDPRVLIPRPETEILVETALELAPREGRVVDIGTGSGCIAITLSLERPDLEVYATDLSVDALRVAGSNQKTLQSRVSWIAGDLLAPFRGTFDVIVSNPPYVPAHELEGLQPEVRDHEPRVALSPGEDGTSALRRLMERAPDLLRPGGLLLLEIGYTQQEAVRAAAASAWQEPVFHGDLAAIPRVVVLSLRDETPRITARAQEDRS